MDEPLASISRQATPKSSPFWKTNWFFILALLLLATTIRGWLLCHTEVTSRDSIGFERFAWELEHRNWKEALHSNVHHPLYPLTVLVVSIPLRHFMGGSDLEIMQLSAQLASGLAGVLLVIPMFFLGMRLFDRRVGFWSAVIFQCLPVGARVMSDALSESLFLLTSATALLFALRGFSKTRNSKSEYRSPGGGFVLGIRNSDFGFIGCGLFAGLAYLTRPEGILIIISVAIVFVGRWVFIDRQIHWAQKAKQMTGLIGAAVVVAVPYMVIIHGFSNKTTTQDLLKSEIRNLRSELLYPKSELPSPFRPTGWPSSDRGFPISSFGFGTASFAIWWPDSKVTNLKGQLAWSIYALASELGKGFFYFVWIPALVGLWVFRHLLRNWSGHTALLILCLLQCLAILRVGMVAGYVSDRHVLIVVLCGLFWAVAVVYLLSEQVRANKAWAMRLFPTAGLTFLIIAGTALPKTLEPLHTNRAGHHAVGLWLADHITPADELDDPFCWVAHYAGRTFLREPPVSISTSDQRFRYVVHECRPDHRDRFRKPSARVNDLIAAGGKVVYHWPTDRSLEEAQIILFAVPLPSPQPGKIAEEAVRSD
jgi:4-amino-4-deoxy-L-arabinose transferase-like glycosyltransferase